MKSIIKNKVLVAVLVLISFSCSKDDESVVQPVPEPTVAELVAQKWFLKKLTDNSTTPPTETIANECENNSYYNFLSDGNLMVETFLEDSSSNCISNATSTNTYSLTPDGKLIIIENQSFNIEVISTTEFVFSRFNRVVTLTR